MAGKVGEADKAGWWPLHYAALAGNIDVLRGLLELHADVNRLTSKDEPMLGLPPWMSTLDLATVLQAPRGHTVAARSESRLEGGLSPSVLLAAAADNAEGMGCCVNQVPGHWPGTSLASPLCDVQPVQEVLQH